MDQFIKRVWTTVITARIGNQTFHYQTDLETYFQPFREKIIGIDQTFESPYGQKKIVYADWTASGRLYKPIERKLCDIFGPYMANTHTESNLTGGMMTQSYEEAKQIIKKHVHANEKDVILFDGFGMTSAMAKFQRIFGLKGPETWKRALTIPEKNRPIVFISHMEHHSNHTSWIETIADVVIVPPNSQGDIDLDYLESLLIKYNDRSLKIGAFTACSNVTGRRLPIHDLARIMHAFKGICLIDFAASAPYDDISMHPEDPMAKLDGIFFSPHKFLGGPGASGVAIFDSRLYHNSIPDQPGGGTVLWTNPWGEHHYYHEIEKREDGGTPGILQGIRAALAIKLKEQMGTEKIRKREEELLAILLPGLKKVPGLKILDEGCQERLGIISFCVEGLHYNFIVRLLNDRFGYQVRGGCSCAGTYGHYLLNIDKETSAQITAQLDSGDHSTKPGWVRFSIHPTMTNQEAYEFLRAIDFIVANYDGLKKDYLYDARSNDFFYIRHERANFDELFRLD
jgi:selenocysteine lyase/cysteine desulfurase